MKILLVNSLYPPKVIGGAEVSCQKLAIELSREGHRVFVLTTGEIDCCEEKDGVFIIYRRFGNIMSFWEFKHSTPFRRIIYKFFDIYNPHNRKVINEVLSEIQPDVIHANTIYGITPILWTCGKKYGVPVVQTVRDYYLMCPKANLMKKEGNCQSPRAICQLFRVFHRYLGRNVAALTAPSQYTLNCFLKANYFKNSLSRTIYNAINCDIERFERLAREKQGKRNETVHVAYIGSFIETKGIDVLLEAIQNAPDYMTFHFMGKGRMQKKIENVREKGKRIVIEGFLDETALNNVLENMDVLVCPSVWAEPFGRVIIDGYKSCLPVIATDCGGMPELIDDGVTGRIIEPFDSKAIIDAIEDIRNIGITKKTVQAMRKKLEKFSIEQQGKEFTKLFSEIVVLNERKK